MRQTHSQPIPAGLAQVPQLRQEEILKKLTGFVVRLTKRKGSLDNERRQIRYAEATFTPRLRGRSEHTR
ncbi:protein of unknown function [Candidatus Filomicrobium marinum]|uniref:Transposase n=1 Tax=Candidatus Filomicrobium marinum TaxID=1608628 RepID=A0A0D6J9S4_9HYPH|nr:protein of unknown function [Candidatus Filomicrobium marinum]CPR15010.1 protein of unknown function [Candidatus Filomicrobium marinum]